MFIMRHGYPGVPGDNVMLHRQDGALVEKHPGHLKRNGKSRHIVNNDLRPRIDYHKIAIPIGASLNITELHPVEISLFTESRNKRNIVHARIMFALFKRSLY